MSSHFSLEEQLEAAKAMRASFGSGGKSARGGSRGGMGGRGGARSAASYSTPTRRPGQAPGSQSGSGSRPLMMGPYTVGPSTAATTFKPVSPNRGRGDNVGASNIARNPSPSRLTRPSVLQVRDTVRDAPTAGPAARYCLAAAPPGSTLSRQPPPAVGNPAANWQAFAASGAAAPHQQGFGMPGQASPQQQTFTTPVSVPVGQQGFQTPSPAPATQQAFPMHGQAPAQQQDFMMPSQAPALQQVFIAPASAYSNQQGFIASGPSLLNQQAFAMHDQPLAQQQAFAPGAAYQHGFTALSQAPAQQQGFTIPVSTPSSEQRFMASGLSAMNKQTPVVPGYASISHFNAPAFRAQQARTNGSANQAPLAPGPAIVSHQPLVTSDSPPKPIQTNMDPKEFTKPHCPAHLRQPSSRVAIQHIADSLHVRYEDLTSDGVTIPATNPKSPRRVLGALNVASVHSLIQVTQAPANLAASNWAPANSQQDSQVGGACGVAPNTVAQQSLLSADAAPWTTTPVNNTAQAFPNGFGAAHIGTFRPIQHNRVVSGSAMDLDVPENPAMVGVSAFNNPGMPQPASQMVNTGPGFASNRARQGSASYVEARAFAQSFFTLPSGAQTINSASENVRPTGNLPLGNAGAQMYHTANANPCTQGIQVADNGYGAAGSFQAANSFAPNAQAPSFRSINVAPDPPTANTQGFFNQTVGAINGTASSSDLEPNPPAKKVQTLKDSRWAH